MSLEDEKFQKQGETSCLAHASHAAYFAIFRDPRRHSRPLILNIAKKIYPVILKKRSRRIGAKTLLSDRNQVFQIK